MHSAVIKMQAGRRRMYVFTHFKQAAGKSIVLVNGSGTT